jgi:hypothetical protein
VTKLIVLRGVAFSPDGRTLAAGFSAGLGHDPGKDPGVVLYDLDPQSWQRRACRIANRNLTRQEWRWLIGSDVPYQRLCPDLPDDEGTGRN